MLPYKTPIAFQGSLTLIRDMYGYPVNDTNNHSKNNRIQKLHLAILPLKEKTTVLAFYHKRDRKYKSLKSQFNSSARLKKLDFLNYLIFAYTENYYFSPKIKEKIRTNDKLVLLSQELFGKPNLGQYVGVDSYKRVEPDEIPNFLLEEWAINIKINKRYKKMTYEVKSLNEECGVFGIWGHPDAAKLTYFGLHSLQHRGQEGAGILSNDAGQLKRHRDMGLLSEVFRDPANLDKLTGTAAIGHVRYATAGEASVDNIQPFMFKFHDGQLGLAHNGNLTNAESLRHELEKNGAILNSTSDSEILAHLIRRSHNPSFMGKVKEALSTVKGGFAYLLMIEDKLIAALDPNGFRPLSLGKMSNGAIVVSSETCAFEGVGAEWIRDVNPGEVVIIDDNGITYDTYTTDTQLAVCSMEYIYFARPDSNIQGVNVHTARKRMGAQLAREFKHEADIVVGVPNSSLSAAMGFAEESGLPNEMGLIKNQYTQRTFIQPTQELREQGVRMKLSAVSGVVKGKRVVMIDDSIVRGTTSRRIVNLLKEAGATEVHVAIGSPALAYPCFYGIDIQTRKELIAANHTVEETREIIGADSLTYLSIDGLIDSIGIDTDAPNGGLCVAYFDGKYPTPLYDYEERYLESLKEHTSFY